MRNRNILDQESYHIAAGGQHHSYSKAHEGAFEGSKVPRYALSLLGNGEISQKCEQGYRSPSI